MYREEMLAQGTNLGSPLPISGRKLKRTLSRLDNGAVYKMFPSCDAYGRENIFDATVFKTMLAYPNLFVPEIISVRNQYCVDDD